VRSGVAAITRRFCSDGALMMRRLRGAFAAINAVMSRQFRSDRAAIANTLQYMLLRHKEFAQRLRKLWKIISQRSRCDCAAISLRDQRHISMTFRSTGKATSHCLQQNCKASPATRLRSDFVVNLWQLQCDHKATLHRLRSEFETIAKRL
jgi:transcriptional regulator with GAF, ATPase, and Fis domain